MAEGIAREEGCAYTSLGTFDRAKPTIILDFDGTLVPCRGTGPSAERSLSFLCAFALRSNLIIATNRPTDSDFERAVGPVVEYADRLDDLLSVRAADRTRADGTKRHAIGRASGTLCVRSNPLSADSHTQVSCAETLSIFASLRNDGSRKPCTGLWREINEQLGPIDPKTVTFCGDALGRPAEFGAKRDFADTDYAFALNCGFGAVLSPEQLFLFGPPERQRFSTAAGSAVVAPFAAFQPDVCPASPNRGPAEVTILELCAPGKTLVILAGSPASGKSSLARKIKAHSPQEPTPRRVVVERDVTGGTHFSEIIVRGMLGGADVVIADSTAATLKDRQALVDLAARYDYRALICHVTTPKETCMFLNKYRTEKTGQPALPDVAIHTYWKRAGESPDPLDVSSYARTHGVDVKTLAVPFSPDSVSPQETCPRQDSPDLWKFYT